MTISSIKRKISESFTLSFGESERHFTTYGIAVIVGIFGFYIFNLWVHNNTGYENFVLRLFAAVLAFLLIIRKYWPNNLKSMLKWYWYFTLIYTLPFFFTFMLLHNSTSHIWHINGLICLVVLALFVDWIAYCILVIIGSGSGLLASYISSPHIDPLLPSELKGIILNYIAPIIYIMLFSTKREHIQKEKQQSLRMQAAAIAHEMRTPLAAVANMATGLKNYLPTLIETQQTMQEKEESLPYVSDKVLEPLKLVPTELERVARGAFTVIDTLLLNLQEAPSKIVLERCYILDCVETALKAYSLTDAEGELISLESADNFEIETNTHLLKHVFFNLLKNSLHYIKAAGKGKICIWTEKGEKFNTLHFKDTGKGISPDILPYIFDQFYSHTDHGTGVGLAFCKMVMQKSGGDITCDSVEGEFTHFTLSFPVVQ